MFFSASDLVKKSASQLLFLELNKTNKPSPSKNQISGNQYADNLSDNLNTQKNKIHKEKRGIIPLPNDEDVLFFCVDLIIDNKFIEIKQVRNQDDYPDWYLQNSILQTTFYFSLLQDLESLDTPKFKIKEGYPYEVFLLPEKKNGHLWFGDERFKIYDNPSLKEFYIDKAMLISDSIEREDYKRCKAFDAKYKFKEFDIFKPKFKKLKSLKKVYYV